MLAAGRLTLREILEKIFGLIPRFKSKDAESKGGRGPLLPHGSCQFRVVSWLQQLEARRRLASVGVGYVFDKELHPSCDGRAISIRHSQPENGMLEGLRSGEIGDGVRFRRLEAYSLTDGVAVTFSVDHFERHPGRATLGPADGIDTYIAILQKGNLELRLEISVES